MNDTFVALLPLLAFALFFAALGGVIWLALIIERTRFMHRTFRTVGQVAHGLAGGLFFGAGLVVLCFLAALLATGHWLIALILLLVCLL